MAQSSGHCNPLVRRNPGKNLQGDADTVEIRLDAGAGGRQAPAVMRKRRYLAPWRRPAAAGTVNGTAALAAGLGGDGPAAEQARRALSGKPAIYHCVSRVVGRQLALGDAEKERFVEIMRAYEAFGRLRVLTHCVMGNHFHILVEVPERPAAEPTDGELLAHLRVLYSGRRLREIRWQLGEYRRQENHAAAAAYRQQFLRRMWDLSAFMQSVKQRFSRWYNSREDRDGFLWSERFKSVLVEDGHAARVVAAYIDLNPVRAGIVARPEDYRWSGYAEAVAGRRKAREGLKWLMHGKQRGRMPEEEAAKEAGEWRKVLENYGRFLADDGERRGGSREAKDGRDGNRGRSPRVAGHGKATADRGRSAAPLLSEARMVRCRVRYFTDGLVLGTRAFVDGAFVLTRERFGKRRTSGARKLARAETELRTMRALRVDAYGGG